MNLMIVGSGVGSSASASEHEKQDLLESGLKKLPQIDIPVHHYLSGGVYLREMEVPADSLITGKIYKKAHICVLLKGRISIWRESGSYELSAPCIFTSAAGARRIFYMHEDSRFAIAASIPEDMVSLKEIEDFLYIQNPEERQSLLKLLKLEI